MHKLKKGHTVFQYRSERLVTRMRIIDYYNLGAIAVLLALVLLSVIKKPLFLFKVNKDQPLFQRIIIFINNSSCQRFLFFFLTGLGIFLRFYRLAVLPEGLHQDEASNSYEAFCLANFGIDRNGYHFPVYPITWGSGGGSPVLIYLYALICKFVEPSVFSYRFIFAFLGSCTLLLFYFYLKNIYGIRVALLGLGILSLTPWHIIISRWGLDSNTIPFWCMIILLLFYYAGHTQKTGYYVLTAAFCALILYCYGSATFVMPFFVLLSCSYLLYLKKMTFRQLIFSGIAFLIVVFPLAVFYFINVFDLQAITTAYFSVPRFTGSHTDTVFITFDKNLPLTLAKNLLHLLTMLTVGVQDELWNYMPGYFTLYHFTFPITFLGVFVCFRKVWECLKKKQDEADCFMVFMFLSAFLVALFMKPNINRIIFIFLPLVYFMVTGFLSLKKASYILAVPALVIFLLGAGSFTKDYFTIYGSMSNYLFMKGYGDAIRYAESIRKEDQHIYSTYENLASPFITALLYSRTSPYDYLDTAVYKGEEAEFKVATAFTHYTFGLPEDIEDPKYKEHLIIIENSERERFRDLGYEMIPFGNYVLLTLTS